MRQVRMKRELEMLTQSPPPGITCWSYEDAIDHLHAQILGPEGTPYHKGIFKLEVLIPERYPLEPPKVRFLTPIYHPNIDDAGRICLDSLKMPPKGAWKPALNVSTILTSIQQLMCEPNPDDPLMPDIAEEFRYKRPTFEEEAKRWTAKHAIAGHAHSNSAEQGCPSNEGIHGNIEMGCIEDKENTDSNVRSDQAKVDSSDTRKRIGPLNTTEGGKKSKLQI